MFRGNVIRAFSKQGGSRMVIEAEILALMKSSTKVKTLEISNFPMEGRLPIVISWVAQGKREHENGICWSERCFDLLKMSLLFSNVEMYQRGTGTTGYQRRFTARSFCPGYPTP